MRTRSFSSKRVVLLLGVLCAFCPGRRTTAQEQWFFMQRHHLDGQSSELVERHGVWRFVPGGIPERVYTFAYNPFAPVPDNLVSPELGYGSFLTAFEDKLVFSSYPALLLSDPRRGKILSRLASVIAQDAPCAIQGPFLGEQEAKNAGFSEAGIVGVRQPYLLDSVPCSDTGAGFFFRSLSGVSVPVPVHGGDLGFSEILPGKIAFDATRGGLWVTDGRFPVTLAFVPLREGRLLADQAWRVAWPEGAASPRECRWLFVDHPGAHLTCLGPDEAGVGRLFRLDANTKTSEIGPRWPSPLEPGSGLTTPPEPITVTPGGLFPAQQKLLLPIVAHVSGQKGTFWTTTLWLFNPSSQPIDVELRSVVSGNSLRLLLGAHGSARIADVVPFLRGGPGGSGSGHDALLIASPFRGENNLVAVARLSTPAGRDGATANGTMGHAVPAVPFPFGYANHLDDFGYNPAGPAERSLGLPSVLLLDRRNPNAFRHNLGVANVAGEPITVALRWGCDPQSMDCDPAREKRLEVPARSVKIWQIESLFDQRVLDSSPAVVSVSASRPVPIFYSQVDNKTGDATFVPYSHWTSFPGPTTSHVFPVIASAPGENGSSWATALYLYPQPLALDLARWRGLARHIEARLFPASPSLCGQETEIIADLSHALVASSPGSGPLALRSVVPDLVSAFAPCASVGNVKGGMLLRVGNWTEAYARTFTTREDGGTFGEMLPLYPERGYPEQHFAGIEVSPQFRVNVGFFNAQARTQTLHLDLYAADGSLAATQTLTLAPWQSLQQRLEDLFDRPRGSLPHGTYGLSVLPQPDPDTGEEGHSWAYVSLVDNLTNDPTNWW